MQDKAGQLAACGLHGLRHCSTVLWRLNTRQAELSNPVNLDCNK